MKAATVSELKKELKELNHKELLEFCLRLSKFKKENKELLTYLLFEAEDETSYIESVKEEVDNQFDQINTSSYYFIKKSARKILRIVRKYIRYSNKKETEVELLIYYCQKLKDLEPSISHNRTLMNLYDRQMLAIRKSISTLHEDLQYDYKEAISNLE